jgi:hypothetical protein
MSTHPGSSKALHDLLAMVLLAGSMALAGCGQKQEAVPVATSPPTAAPPPTQAPIVPAPAVTQASWAPDALEELLAPIALYPDSLLSQILAASVNAQEVLDAGNWLLQNETLKGSELDAAAQSAGFGPAMRSLIQFPTVVDMMCQQIDWTRQLGSAFTSDQAGVLDAVQRLRAQAAQVGNLKSTPEQKVETKTVNEKVIVEVKPADPQVVYVPQYNPAVVYTTPPPPPPKEEDTVSTGTAVAAGLLAFGVGVLIGNAMDDDCYPNWGYGAVYYGPRPFYPPAYVYRPVYGPAFRPAYHYAPPAGYRHNYNNVNVRNDVNINIDNRDYYNRFNNNQNLHGGTTRSPLARQRDQAQARVGQSGGGVRNESWKGQSTYAGAHDDSTTQRLDQAADKRPGAGKEGTRQLPSANDPQFGTAASNRVAQKERPAQADRAEARVDRGYGDSARTANLDSRARSETARELRDTSDSQRDHAFSGTQAHSGGGSFDRAASARGHASGGGRQAAGRSGGRRR